MVTTKPPPPRPPSPPAVHVRYPAHPRSVERARLAVSEFLRAAGCAADDARDEAALVVSELVTNAVLHTSAAEVALTVSWDGDRLTVACADSAWGALPHLPEASDEFGGRGLRIVAGLAVEWGVHVNRLRRQKSVWAVLHPHPVPGVTAAPPTSTATDRLRT